MIFFFLASIEMLELKRHFSRFRVSFVVLSCKAAGGLDSTLSLGLHRYAQKSLSVFRTFTSRCALLRST